MGDSRPGPGRGSGRHLCVLPAAAARWSLPPQPGRKVGGRKGPGPAASPSTRRAGPVARPVVQPSAGQRPAHPRTAVGVPRTGRHRRIEHPPTRAPREAPSGETDLVRGLRSPDPPLRGQQGRCCAGRRLSAGPGVPPPGVGARPGVVDRGDRHGRQVRRWQAVFPGRARRQPVGALLRSLGVHLARRSDRRRRRGGGDGPPLPVAAGAAGRVSPPRSCPWPTG